MYKKIIYTCFVISFLFFSCKDQGINNTTESISQSTNSVKLSKPIGSHLTSSDGSPLLNRVMSVSDPMRDPDWDWTTDSVDTLYITSYDSPKLVRRPYFSSGSIKSFFTGIDGSRDIWPEDGWELVLRDFGTSQYDVSTPFYLLYNKHTGILRYIYFGNLVNQQIDYATATLSLKGSVTSPFFTLSDSASQSLNNYHTYKQHTISKYYHDQWNVMDFRMAGFDPDIANKYARFIIDVDAYTDFDLKAGGSLSLDGTIGSGGSTHSQFLNLLSEGARLYTNISKGYKDIKTAQENYDEMLEYAQDNDNAWWSGILATAATVGATSWIPALGPAVGVARFILGGGSSQSRQPKPITLSGRIQLEGKISNTTDIDKLEFIVPGARVDNPAQAASYNELPLYNKKPGIFNLTNAPAVSAKAFGDCINQRSSARQIDSKKQYQKSYPSLTIKNEKPAPKNDSKIEAYRPPPGGSCDTFIGYIQYKVSSLNYVINKEIFESNEQVDLAFTYRNQEATEYMDVTDGSTVVNIEFNNKDIWGTWVTGWRNYFEDVGILAQLTLKNASPSVSKVSLLKAYEPDYGQMENLGITYY